MSLEENFEDAITDALDGSNEYLSVKIEIASKQCVQICDEFAVGFAEWHYKHGRFIQQDLTTTELLEIYKQGL